MTTTTRNAAERLHAIHKEMREDGYLEPLRRPDALLDEVLATAKAEGAREAVERIRHAVLYERDRLGKPKATVRVVDLLGFLDREVAP